MKGAAVAGRVAAWRADAAARFALAQARRLARLGYRLRRSTRAGLAALGDQWRRSLQLRVITATFVVSAARGGGARRRAHAADRAEHHRQQGEGGRQHRLGRPVGGRRAPPGWASRPRPGRRQLMGSIVLKLQADAAASRAATTRSWSRCPCSTRAPRSTAAARTSGFSPGVPRPPASLVRAGRSTSRAAVGRADDHDHGQQPARARPGLRRARSAASTSSTTSSR